MADVVRGNRSIELRRLHRCNHSMDDFVSAQSRFSGKQIDYQQLGTVGNIVIRERQRQTRYRRHTGCSTYVIAADETL